jgi:hypothetical protein
VLKSLTSEHVAVVQAQAGLAATEASAVVNAEIARQSAQANLLGAMMRHPVWWLAWCLFVLPAGLYVALIHLKSLACTFFDAACGWNILRVPPQIEAYDQLVVLSFFGLAAASSVVGMIAARIGAP